MEFYNKRKEFNVARLNKELMVLSNKAKFILQQLDDEIDLRRKKRDQVIQLLVDNKYDVIDGDTEYRYLRSMPIDSVLEENVDKLLKEKGEKEKELSILMELTVETMWNDELDILIKQYQQYRTQRSMRSEGVEPEKKKLKKKIKPTKLKVV
jgi:DNA topoisomerase-2